MKYGLFLMGILFVAPQSAPANTPAFAHCGTYDSYILLYKSVQKFEELGKLHCGESVSITGQDGDYSQVQTTDGRLGWVPSSDLSITAPPPQPAITFGWTEKAKPQLELDAQPDPAPVQPAAQPTESPVVARSSESAPLLTNVNVMKMQGARQSPDAIIAKISASRCDFDTSPAALHRLKLSGVSDRIILAMMHAPAAFPAVPPDAAQSFEVTIPNQTTVQVAISGDVSADNLEEGSVVEMVVVQPVTLNGVTVIPQGAEARARIMAVRRSSMGGSGQVVWFMQDITAASGDRVPANFASSQDTGAKPAIGRFSGYPFFLSEFRKGAPAIEASSDHYTVLVDGNIPLRVAPSSNAEQVAAPPAAQPQAVPQVARTVTTAPVFPVVVQTPDEQTAVKP
ncbi:MAG: SH3 domain-containing protein [Candidatus Acidiferrales bacterium]